MAKKSAVENNEKKRRLVARDAEKRAALKAITKDASLPLEERFQAQLKLAALPRNGAKVRLRNRCEVTGRHVGIIASSKCHVLHYAIWAIREKSLAS